MKKLNVVLYGFLLLLTVACNKKAEQDQPVVGEIPTRPNIIFIMSDDHAKKAISAYDKSLISTPNLDRLANEGALIRNGFVTNSICAPARAAILTGKYSHLNGLRDNRDRFDGSQLTFPKLFQQAGYHTSIIGKWHLKTEPTGFDYWNVLIDQGEYYNPRLVEMGDTTRPMGYTTDIITDKALSILDSVSGDKPFMMMVHHKAPHRNWMPNTKHLGLFKEDLPIPETLFDDYEGRQAAAEQDLSIDRMYLSSDMKLREGDYERETGTGGGPPTANPVRGWERTMNNWLTEEQRTAWNAHYDSVNRVFREANLQGDELTKWKYQRYIKDYLRCIVSVDENVGRLLDYLDEKGLADNTIVVYTSDQGFYLGEHGWYDKRFMYEESFGTPMMVRFPAAIKPGTVNEDLIVNIDFGPTFLDYAGIEVPEEMQGRSFRNIIEGGDNKDWRQAVYYHYYEYPHGWHSVKKHYGIRKDRYKLIHYYDDIDTWELFDLQNDPQEMSNLYDHPEYLDIQDAMRKELYELQQEMGEHQEIIDKTVMKP